MRRISVSKPTTDGTVELFVGFQWNDETEMWIAVVDEKCGKLEHGRGRSQKEALRTAINKLFGVVQGYDPSAYGHDQVWAAYEQAPPMPESPIISIPV